MDSTVLFWLLIVGLAAELIGAGWLAINRRRQRRLERQLWSARTRLRERASGILERAQQSALHDLSASAERASQTAVELDQIKKDVEQEIKQELDELAQEEAALAKQAAALSRRELEEALRHMSQIVQRTLLELPDKLEASFDAQLARFESSLSTKFDQLAAGSGAVLEKRLDERVELLAQEVLRRGLDPAVRRELVAEAIRDAAAAGTLPAAPSAASTDESA